MKWQTMIWKLIVFWKAWLYKASQYIKMRKRLWKICWPLKGDFCFQIKIYHIQQNWLCNMVSTPQTMNWSEFLGLWYLLRHIKYRRFGLVGLFFAFLGGYLRPKNSDQFIVCGIGTMLPWLIFKLKKEQKKLPLRERL